MVDRDSTGPSLQLIGAQFLNFLLRKLSCEFKLCEMLILHEFRMTFSYFCTAEGYSHMLGHADSYGCPIE